MRGRKTFWILWALMGLMLLSSCGDTNNDNPVTDGDSDEDVNDDDDDDSDGDVEDDDDDSDGDVDDDDDDDSDGDDECDNVTCGNNAHCQDGLCVCDDYYWGDAEAGCDLAQLSLPDSLDGTVFMLDGCYATEAEEVHSEAVQIDSLGLADGEGLTATIDGGTAVTLSVENSGGGDDGLANWPVVLAYGEHQLRVEVTGNPDIFALATVRLAGCSICPDPADGTVLTGEDDLDSDAPNIQHDVLVNVRHVNEGANVSLSLDANDLGLQSVTSGVATWPGVEFTHNNDDGHTLSFAALDTLGNTCESQISVRAVVDDCIVLVSTPIAVDETTGYWNLEDLGNNLDEDAATDGVQVTFTAQVDTNHVVVCQNTEMTFTFTHTEGDTETPEEVTVPIGDDNTSFTHQFTIPEGVNTFRANIVDATDANLKGSSGALAHNLDTVAPVPGSYEFSSGQQTCDAPIHMTLVEDENLSLTDGIQFNLTGTVEGLQAGDEFCAQVRFADPGLEDVDPDPVCAAYVDSGIWAFSDLTIPRPAEPSEAGDDGYTLSVWFTDVAGNRAELTAAPCGLTADFRPVSESLKIIGVGKGGDPEEYYNPFDEDVIQPICLVQVDDADDGTAGLQVEVKIEAPQLPVGTDIAIQVDELSPVYGTTDGDRIAKILLTVNPGVHTLQAAATSLGVTLYSNIVSINSALNPPSMSFVSPTEGTYFQEQNIAVVLSSSASDGQMVTVSHNGSDVSEALANGRANLNVSLSAGDGLKSLEASVEDVCGNIGNASLTVNLDMTAPTPVFVTPVDEDTIGVSDPTPITVSFDGETAGRTAYLYIYTSDPEAGSPSPISTMTDVLEDNGGTIQAEFSFAFADGNYWLKAAYRDQGGNLGEEVIHVTVNTGCYTNTLAAPFSTANVRFGIGDADGGNIANGVTRSLSVLGIGSNIATNQLVTVRINGSVAGSTMVDGFGEATINNLHFPSEGTYSLVATFEHPSGTGTCTLLPGGITVVVDFTPPAFSQIEPAATANPQSVPVTYNCASLNQGDTASFRFGVSPEGGPTLEEGQLVQLTVSNQAGTFTSTPYEATVEGGEIQFNDVTIHGSLLPDLSTVTLTLEAEDLAGNTGSYVFTAKVDKQVPYFTNFIPSETTLTDDFNPATDEFDLALSVVVMYGTPGTGNLRAQYRVGDDIFPLGAEYFNLVEQGTNQTRASITGTLPQGAVTILLSHTDAFGNESCSCISNCTVGCCTGQSGPREKYYYIDSTAASIEFRDGANPFPLLSERSTTWAASRDEDLQAPGFQGSFLAVVGGMLNGVTVRVCSDLGDTSGDSVITGERCQGDAEGGAGYYIVAQKVISTDDTVKQVFFEDVPLLNESSHTMYVEAVDTVRYVRSEMGTLTVDSVRPSIDSWSITSNNVDNDGQDLWLNGSEGTVQDGNFQMDLSINSSSTDLVRARVYRSSGDTNTLLVAKDMNQGEIQATFTRAGSNPVVLPLSPATHTIKVQLVDNVGNTSDLTVAAAAETLRIDTIAPTVSILDGGDPMNLFSCDCGGDITGSCQRNVTVSLGTQAGEPFPTRDVTVTLSNGVDQPISRTVPANSGSVAFTDVPFPQGDSTLTVSALDEAHNEAEEDTNSYTTDSLLPTLTLDTPSGDTTYTDSECTQNGQVIVCSGWQFTLGATNRAALVELQKRPTGAGDDAWVAFSDSSSWSFAASENPQVQAIGDVSLERGAMELRLVATETGTCNNAATNPVTITADFTVTLVIGGYHADGRAISGADLHFTADEKTGTGGSGEFLASILVIGNDATDGMNPSLTVNGTLISDSETIAFDAGNGDYRVVYTNVPLKEWDCSGATPRNTIRIDIGSGDDATFWSQTGIIADSGLPTVSFSNPDPALNVHTWNREADRDGQINGQVLPLAAGPDLRIKLGTTGLEAGQVATLTAMTDQGQTVGLSNNTALVVVDDACDGSGSVVFENLAIPNAGNNLYIELKVAIEDLSGNAANFTGQALRIHADDDPPAASLGVCIGEATDSVSPESYQQEPAACAGYCGSTPEEIAENCSRRAGSATLFFNAEGNGTTLTTQDIDVDSLTFGYMETSSPEDCSDFSWDNATTSDDLDWQVVGEGDGGETLLIRGKNILANIGMSYCFAIQVMDVAGNTTESDPVAREIPLYTQVLGSNLSTSADIYLGYASAVGDFNCDGRDDIAISDVYADDSRGSVYVWYGNDTPSGTPDVTLSAPVGLEGGSFGYRLAAGNVGDNDTETCDDLLVGSFLVPAESGSGVYGSYEGHVELFFGSSSGLPSVADYYFDGANVATGYGYWNAIGADIAIGNFDGDAFDDIVLGADNPQDGYFPGPVFLYKGRSHDDWAALDANSDGTLFVNALASPYCDTCDLSIVAPVGSTGNIGFYAGYNHGLTVSTVDLNHDGIMDVIVDNKNSLIGGATQDRVHVLLGDANFWDYTAPLQEGSGEDGIFVTSEATLGTFDDVYPGFAGSVGGPSFNGDEYGDILFVGNSGKKRIFLWYGGMEEGNAVITQGSYRLPNTGTPDLTFHQAGFLGDMNGDGYSEVFGTGYNDAAGEEVTRFSIWYGSSASDPAAQLPDPVTHTHMLNLGTIATQGDTLYGVGRFDWNQDGYMDVGLSNSNRNAVYLLW